MHKERLGIATMVQALPEAGTYLPVEDYAVIGDLHTAALVG
jgi:hypothetical protein